MTTYQVTATRDGDWWSLVAHDVQGREIASQAHGWEVPFANFASDGVGYLLAEHGDPPTVHFPITR